MTICAACWLACHAQLLQSQCCVQVEYASAGRLADKCAGRKLPEAEARALFAQLLGGLAYCHGKGVYHRDLRTELLLLSGRYLCLDSAAITLLPVILMLQHAHHPMHVKQRALLAVGPCESEVHTPAVPCCMS